MPDEMIGIDVGFDTTKIYKGKGKTASFPSVFGVYRGEDEGVDTSENRVNNIVLELNGVKYAIGNSAIIEGGVATFDKNNMQRHLLCSLAGIALVTNGEYTGPVVMGLPISDQDNKELKENIEKLKDEYNYTFCGVPVKVNITDIYIMPQAGATFYDMIFDEKGGYDAESPALKGRVGYADVGGKTLDYVVYNKGQRVKSECGSANLGMNNAYKRLQKEIQKKLKFTPRTYEVLDYADKIPEETKSIYSELANEVIDATSNAWNDFGQFEKIYITGGGATALHKYIAERYENWELIKDAQFSNARGYYKWGMASLQNK